MAVGSGLSRDALAPQFINPLGGQRLERIGGNQERLHLQQRLVLRDGRCEIARLLQRLTEPPMPFRFSRGFWIDGEQPPERSDRDLVLPVALRRGDIGP